MVCMQQIYEAMAETNAFLIFAVAGFFVRGGTAQNLNTIGVTALRRVATNVNGSGIRVAQPEADDDTARDRTGK